MKYFIFFSILLISQIVYSQDLIVTSTGDSLHCKIIDVNADEIQFRFGKNGNVISIRRNETVAHRYNYKPLSASNRKTGASADKYPPLYIALSSGASTFGKISTGNAERGGTLALGADVGWFFNPKIGAGLKLIVADCNINFDNVFLCHDRVMFYGPALYIRLGKGKLALAANAGVGGLSWTMSDVRIEGVSKDNASATGMGGFVSAGVNYMATRNIGLGINVQSLLGSIKSDDYERNPTSVGGVFNINFRF